MQDLNAIEYLAVAIITSTLVIKPGVRVAGARLDYPVPSSQIDQIGLHVVGEAGRRLSAVHHAGEAVAAAAAAAGAGAGLDGAHVGLLVGRRAVLLLYLVGVGVVRPLNLCQFDQFGRALDAGHVHDGRVVWALANALVKAVPEGRKEGRRE